MIKFSLIYLLVFREQIIMIISLITSLSIIHYCDLISKEILTKYSIQNYIIF